MRPSCSMTSLTFTPSNEREKKFITTDLNTWQQSPTIWKHDNSHRQYENMTTPVGKHVNMTTAPTNTAKNPTESNEGENIQRQFIYNQRWWPRNSQRTAFTLEAYQALLHVHINKGCYYIYTVNKQYMYMYLLLGNRYYRRTITSCLLRNGGKFDTIHPSTHQQQDNMTDSHWTQRESSHN